MLDVIRVLEVDSIPRLTYPGADQLAAAYKLAWAFFVQEKAAAAEAVVRILLFERL